MNIFSKIKKAIFGYDIFISYSRIDSMGYAYAIAQYFAKKNYKCYIDQLSNTTPGNQLPKSVKKAVEQSTALVLIASEGSINSTAVKEELELYLSINKNSPLIPISIEKALFKDSEISKIIGGLASIEDSKENLKQSTPALNVLDWIENALIFTKKSIKLRNTAVSIVIGVFIISVSAALYSIIKTKEAKRANDEKAMAEKSKMSAEKSASKAIALRDTALIQRDEAENLKKKTEKDLKAASSKLVLVNEKLNTAMRNEVLLNKKNEIKELVFKAKTEHVNLNTDLAFKYAKEALFLEKSIKGSNSATFLLADFFNSYTPKFLKKDLMPFSYNEYGSDRKETISGMKVFDMNLGNTQVFCLYSEPRITDAGRIKNGWDYCETWIKKHFQIGMIDIKGDSLITLSKHENGINKYYSIYGYFFTFSSENQKYYLVTDENPESYSNSSLVLYELDRNLQILKTNKLDDYTSQYLLGINNHSKEGIFYYIHSCDFSNSHSVLYLTHFDKSSTVIKVELDSSDFVHPQTYTLNHLKFNQFNFYKLGYQDLSNIKITSKSIFFRDGDSLFERRFDSDTERPIHKIIRGKNYEDKESFKYIVSEKLNMLFVLDSASHFSVYKKNKDEWGPVLSNKFDHFIRNFDFDENKKEFFFYGSYDGYKVALADFFNEFDNELSQKFGYSPNSDFFCSTENGNFHFENDNGLAIIDNNHFDTKKYIPTAEPTFIKFSPSTKALLCLDFFKGDVSVTDLSNITLPEVINDDYYFDQNNFKEITPFSLASSITKEKDNVKLQATKNGFSITTNNIHNREYKPKYFISDIGFVNKPNEIYFFSTDDYMSANMYFNTYDIATGNRSEYALNKLLKGPSEYQITKKFIYFSDIEYGNDKKITRKIIRIVNPFISIREINELLSKSIY